jgi:uncharacterized membrane protein
LNAPESPKAAAVRNGSNNYRAHATELRMFNFVSLIIGLVALVCALVAFLPLLGWANWLIIPLAVIGAVIGMLSRGTAGRNLNLFVIVVGVVRLMLGGGIL